jgi:hypothetical protein
MANSENLKTQTFAEGNEAASIPNQGFGVKRAALAPGKRMLSVSEFCYSYGIGKTLGYAEMKFGRLRFCICGRRRLIAVDDAEAWLASTRQLQPPCGPDSSNRGAE